MATFVAAGVGVAAAGVAAAGVGLAAFGVLLDEEPPQPAMITRAAGSRARRGFMRGTPGGWGWGGSEIRTSGRPDSQRVGPGAVAGVVGDTGGRRPASGTQPGE